MAAWDRVRCSRYRNGGWKTNALISVIVPIYNFESCIRKCVDSILCQIYSNIELILVDDDSQDQSGAICDEYQRYDSRVKVLHKENGGTSEARNYGLDMAEGEYIGFVDGDDFIDTLPGRENAGMCVKSVSGNWKC